LPPAVGAILMSASTIVVAANAQLVRRVNLRPWDEPSPTADAPPSLADRRLDEGSGGEQELFASPGADQLQARR
jgi:hypothetical protein